MKTFYIFFISLFFVQHAFAFGLFKSIKTIDSTDPGPTQVGAYNQENYAFDSGGCGNVPSKVINAYKEAKHFSMTCATANLAPGKMIAVNDYSGGGTPRMYIMSQSGNCVKSVPISWGVGRSKSGKMQGCSTENSLMTPPGMHITATHEGARYGSSNSIGLAGLCGQNSLGARGILIHPSKSQGTPSTWGCTGVPPSDFSQIQQQLGVGSLVYNYFGNQPQECSDSAGFTNTCNPEPKAVEASRSSTGGPARYHYQPAESTTPSDSQGQSGTK